MAFTRILIANRGEVAVRVARACADLGIESVAVYAEDDAASLHVRRATRALALSGRGPAAYLDAEQLIAAAKEAGCDAIHPGYGFLSETAALARAVAGAGLTFIGPRPEVLELLGDKQRAREHASALGVPVLQGAPAESADDIAAFMRSLDGAAVVIKAASGGGGRGMRVVRDAAEIASAFERARSEAAAAFGDGRLYAERLLESARHVEVQVLGERDGNVTHLGERDCTLQRRHQKLVEIAPSPFIDEATRAAVIEASLRLARNIRLDNLATFEFLVDADTGAVYFIEANARLQVEHTVTEQVSGVDLVQAQVALAAGQSLSDLGLDQPPPVRGCAIQLRVNAETIDAAGAISPSAGVLRVFDPPTGPGVRVDTHAYAGYEIGTAYDTLLAKVIVHAPHVGGVLSRARRALSELRVGGVATNAALLQAIIAHPDFAAGRAYTRFVDDHAAELVKAAVADETPARGAGFAGARLDTSDPLAVLDYGKSATASSSLAGDEEDAPPGMVAARAPLQGTVIAVEVREGETVAAGQALLVMEAMKMEHVVVAPAAGVVERVAVAVGDTVPQGRTLALLRTTDAPAEVEAAATEVELDAIRPDLQEALDRHEIGLDAARVEAVARHHAVGHRTARENIADLCDPGSFVEYGPLVVAAQRRRRTLDDLIANTPADGMVAGIGTVNADRFGPERSRVIAMSYDYMVLAGTQGAQNHRKKDRMFELAERWRLPVVFFTEGGGGRPGDTDGLGVAGLDVMAFHLFGRLSGLVPLVGIVAGRCFAGNAAILGCCDVTIATKDANIGMGGPAMVEGGGLGVFRPEEIGPADVQYRNGVIDVLVDDEAAAVAAAKQYLSYFQGDLAEWTCGDQRRLRHAIPENRRRAYDVRAVIEGLADTGSVLELRRGFGAGMVTALVRVEGRPLGLIANNPMHLAGAIDSEAADKATRFMQLCDAFGLPLVSLVDTPGIMVGPEIEKTALVRHASRLFVTGANLEVPVFAIVLRKGYGLGAQAMAGGSFRAPFFTASWPTGEFGGMGLEGAVKLGYRNELAAIEDPEERRRVFEEMVERMYRVGKAVNMASHFEIDDVIDPADTRRWITSALRSLPPPEPRPGKRRPNVDTW